MICLHLLYYTSMAGRYSSSKSGDFIQYLTFLLGAFLSSHNWALSRSSWLFSIATTHHPRSYLPSDWLAKVSAKNFFLVTDSSTQKYSSGFGLYEANSLGKFLIIGINKLAAVVASFGSFVLVAQYWQMGGFLVICLQHQQLDWYNYLVSTPSIAASYG